MGRAEHQDEGTVTFSVSGLAAHLLRRANEPIGIIDLRQAERLHSRASLSLGRRSELLNDLKARYGVGHGEDGVAAPIAGGTTFDAALQRTLAAGQFASAAASVRLPATAANEVGEVAWTSSALSAPQYRVKRAGRGGATSNSAMRLDREGGETSTLSDRGLEVDPPSAIERGGWGQDKLARVGELPPPTAMTQLHTAGEAIPPASRNADRSPPPVGYGAPAFSGRPLDGQSPSRNAALGSETSSAGVTVAPVRALLGGSLVQRKADHPPASRALDSAQTADTGIAMALVAADGRLHQAVFRETTAATLPRESARIVWRNADAGRAAAAPVSAMESGVVVPSGTRTMRRSDSEPTSRSGAMPLTGPAFARDAVDVVRIAEQVNRIIARQFRVELERRGRAR
jgi:hypothetical protein